MKRYLLLLLLAAIFAHPSYANISFAHYRYSHYSDKSDVASAQQRARQQWIDDQLAQMEKEKQAKEQERIRIAEEKKKKLEKERKAYEKMHGYLDAETVKQVISCAPPKIKEILDLYKTAETDLDDKLMKKIIINQIMLVGVPGTGKTLLAKAIAQYLGMDFYFLEASTLSTSFKDSGAENLRKKIEEAIQKSKHPAIIIDELPVLVDIKKDQYRSDTDPGATLWQIMDRYNENKEVMFIATGNAIDKLPGPLKDRFDKATINVGLPNAELRKSALRHHFSIAYTLNDELLATFVKLTDKFSYRKIKDFSEEVMYRFYKNKTESLSYREYKKIADQLKNSKITIEYDNSFRGCHLNWNEKNWKEQLVCGSIGTVRFAWEVTDVATRGIYVKDTLDKWWNKKQESK